MTEFSDQGQRWDSWAGYYDEDSRGHLVPDDAVAALVLLAQGGPVLELGIGTGRVAIPLAEHGIPVVGIDASPEIVKRLLDRRDELPIEVHP
jgi:cyclopropane fatty-acyl-phospholipid synthase-like methyltransferase